jgi:hypothetical protein
MYLGEIVTLECSCGATIRASVAEACLLGWFVSVRDKTLSPLCPKHDTAYLKELQKIYEDCYTPSWEVRDPDGYIVAIHLKDPRLQPGLVLPKQTVAEVNFDRAHLNVVIQRENARPVRPDDPLLKLVDDSS